MSVLEENMLVANTKAPRAKQEPCSDHVSKLVKSGIATAPVNRVIGQARGKITTPLDVGAMLDADRDRFA